MVSALGSWGFRVKGLRRLGFRVCIGLVGVTWEFPKIGEPNIVPEVVGSLL